MYQLSRANDLHRFGAIWFAASYLSYFSEISIRIDLVGNGAPGSIRLLEKCFSADASSCINHITIVFVSVCDNYKGFGIILFGEFKKKIVDCFCDIDRNV